MTQAILQGHRLFNGSFSSTSLLLLEASYGPSKAQGTFPPYRLRVDDVRVYYDVHEDDQVVVVYGIVRKEKSADWLDSKSESHEKERGP